MATILCIETSTKVCSVALGVDGQTFAIRESHEERFTHAENLNRFVEEVINEAGKTFSDLDAVAVSGGPGSYTGLRIGVSSAKGYCYALDIPLIAVDTLRAMAGHADIEAGFIIPMIDARRMEVFSTVYNANYEEIKPVESIVLDEHTFHELDGPIVILGDGAPKFAEITNRNDVTLMDKFPSATRMVNLAESSFNNSKFEDVAYYEPFYLKDFVAGKPKKLL